MGKKGKKGAGRRKPGIGPRLALGIVTTINLALTLALTVQRRKDTLRVIQEGDVVKLLAESSPKEVPTKTEDGQEA